jgi:hypothetical protein
MKLWTAVLIFMSTFNANAETGTGSVPITRIRTGWAADQFAIETVQAILNPANCPAPNGYHSAGTDPGFKTFYAAALMAFSAGKNVNIMVSDKECSVGGPRIIGISVDK